MRNIFKRNQPPDTHNPDFEWPDPRLKIKWPCKHCGSTDIKIQAGKFVATGHQDAVKVFFPQCGRCGRSDSERWKSETNAVTFWNQRNKPIGPFPVPGVDEFYDGRYFYGRHLEDSKTWNKIAASRAWDDIKTIHPRLKPYDPPCYHLTLWERFLGWLITL